MNFPCLIGWSIRIFLEKKLNIIHHTYEMINDTISHIKIINDRISHIEIIDDIHFWPVNDY